MGDSGDYWRDRDEHRKRQERKMVRCENIYCNRLVYPGETCPTCGEENTKQEPHDA